MAYRGNLFLVKTDGRHRYPRAAQRNHVQHPGQGNEARDDSAPDYPRHGIPPTGYIAKTFPANPTWCSRVGARSYSFTAVSGTSTPTPPAKITRRPRSNQGYWLPKLERNAARDVEHQANLTASGWDVLVLWECDVKVADGIADRIREFLERR